VVKSTVPSARPPLVAPPQAPASPVRQPPATARQERLRPGAEQKRPTPPPSFDKSLDALVRDGVVKPSERVRVRGNLVLPTNSALRQQACSNGALSVQECNSGVVFLGRGRRDGKGSMPLSGLHGAGVGATSATLAAGRRFGIDATPLPPISVPVSALLSGAAGNFRLTDVFRVTPRPGPVSGNGNSKLLFPLIGSAITTSNFGWRIHPVIGSWLMHAGRDLAAPEGTPVVAALSGRVVSSGVAGGYGLAIEIEHSRPRRRTLYGHLSELYVKAGETVRQGEVIGRVGSTGLSTGPHLHFELRLPQDGGWVAVEPGDMDSSTAMIAGFPGLPQGSTATPSDAVALLMGQLIETLERPRSPLPLPGEKLDANPPAAETKKAG